MSSQDVVQKVRQMSELKALHYMSDNKTSVNLLNQNRSCTYVQEHGTWQNVYLQTQ